MKSNVPKYPFAAWKSNRHDLPERDGESDAGRAVRGEPARNLGPAPEFYGENERTGTSVPHGGGSADKRR